MSERAKSRNRTKLLDTVTCPHCRYERPAKDAHCHICGYPFPWTSKSRPRRADTRKKNAK